MEGAGAKERCALSSLIRPVLVSIFWISGSHDSKKRVGLSPLVPSGNSIQFNSIQFYLYSAFNKGALSQSCFTENRPQ